MNAIPKFLLLLMLIPALAMANGPSSHTVIGFLPDLDNIVVNVTFSGGDTVEFIVENGAQFSVVNSQFTSRFEWLDYTAVKSMGVDGDISVVGTVLIDSLWVGDIVVTDFAVAAMDLSDMSEELEVAGLLGADFLSDFAWTLDYSSNRIILDRLDESGKLVDPRATFISSKPTYTIGFERQLHLICTEAQFSKDVTGYVALDCGDRKGAISPEIFSKLPQDAYSLVRTDTLVDADGNPMVIQSIILRNLAIGTVVCGDYPVFVVDMSNVNSAGLRVPVDAIIGYNFFEDWLITTRFDEKSIELRPIPK